jgi:hypothetical protein
MGSITYSERRLKKGNKGMEKEDYGERTYDYK